jgi:hypothetical protein
MAFELPGKKGNVRPMYLLDPSTRASEKELKLDSNEGIDNELNITTHFYLLENLNIKNRGC